jgi:hypothetical protein
VINVYLEQKANKGRLASPLLPAGSHIYLQQLESFLGHVAEKFNNLLYFFSRVLRTGRKRFAKPII